MRGLLSPQACLVLLSGRILVCAANKGELATSLQINRNPVRISACRGSSSRWFLLDYRAVRLAFSGTIATVVCRLEIPHSVGKHNPGADCGVPARRCPSSLTGAERQRFGKMRERVEAHRVAGKSVPTGQLANHGSCLSALPVQYALITCVGCVSDSLRSWLCNFSPTIYREANSKLYPHDR